jgi:hypothetical protein
VSCSLKKIRPELELLLVELVLVDELLVLEVLLLLDELLEDELEEELEDDDELLDEEVELLVDVLVDELVDVLLVEEVLREAGSRFMSSSQELLPMSSIMIPKQGSKLSSLLRERMGLAFCNCAAD